MGVKLPKAKRAAGVVRKCVWCGAFVGRRRLIWCSDIGARVIGGSRRGPKLCRSVLAASDQPRAYHWQCHGVAHQSAAVLLDGHPDPDAPPF